MKTKIQKWGNSLAVRIPKSFATEVGLTQDAVVEVTLGEGKLIIAPEAKPSLTLQEILAGVTKQNVHHEVDTGPAVGNEVW